MLPLPRAAAGLALLVALGACGTAGAPQTPPTPATQVPPQPGFDCARAEWSAEEAVCASPLLSALDAEVARLFEAAIAAETGEAARMLRAEQRGWIKGRNDCWKAAAGLEACVRDVSALRMLELRERSAAARAAAAGETGSTGPFRWECGAETLDAAFLTGPFGAAALRRAEGIAVALPQVRSGSGARYAEGDAVWHMKGPEAQFTPPEGGAPRACRLQG